MRRLRLLLWAGVLTFAWVVPAASAEPDAGGDGGAAVPVETFELSNGMRFLLVRRPEITTVSAGWVAHVGSANEHPGITGLAHLFEHMMFKGTTTVGTHDIKRDLEIIREQEDVQDQVRAEYARQRERWRRGEIDDPYDPDARSQTLLELQGEFDKLVAEQRKLMVKDEFDQIYTEAGASSMNAFTTDDMTMYVVQVPANKLELWFWMESDRLLHPVFREFYSERDVVYEERRLRTESTPTGKFDEELDAMFWESHPYSWPTVGWPSDLRVISQEQAQRFFDTYYAPNNITAVLVGSFDLEQVKTLAERYFARIPRGKREPPDVVTLEMPQLAEKRMIAECDCQPQIQIRYHTVPFEHRDSYALDVLSGVLNGRTGRLYPAMVEGAEGGEGIAASASAFQSSSKYAGYFAFVAEAKGEAEPADLEREWDAVIERLQQEPVSEEELAKVKNQTAADVFRRLESPFFLMFQLGLYDGSGDWSYLDTLAERTRAVTAADVQRVAQHYLTTENRLVGYYERKAGTEATELPPELEAVPEQMRSAVQAQLRQLQSIEDVGQLRQILQQLEAGAAQAPPEMQGVIDLLRRSVQSRIEELESKMPTENQKDEGGEP